MSKTKILKMLLIACILFNTNQLFAEMSKTIEVAIVKIELITPKPTPAGDPIDSGEGQNEFTFGELNPEKLEINFR